MIHWVALRPAYHGRGLGSAILSHALALLKKWHQKAFLLTDTRRIAAIGLYLKFGFVPDMEFAEAQKRWSEVAKTIEHPAIKEALTRGF